MGKTKISYETAEYMLMDKFGWTPGEVDGIDPVKFDKILARLNMQREIEQRNYETEMAKMRK